MRKSQVCIGSGSVFLLIGVILVVRVLNRFTPVLDGDSILPDALGVLSDFPLWDYFYVSLSAGLLFTGLFLLLHGIVIQLMKRMDAK